MPPRSDLDLTIVDGGAGAICRAVLATLPTWFGVPDANAGYIEHCDRTPTLVASSGGEPVGLTNVVRHFPEAAEVHLMAVVPEHHRHGIGRRMLEHVEAGLARDGIRFLQVKTLSPSHPDAGYVKTRAFYRAYGFVPLEEMPDLWDPANPALVMIKTVPPPA